ncbi:MAG: PDZ domain-containing protein [Nanoarchaeota archaeon]|nr:PDZ domain-containing protein [Nanoarchaeota archaeon]
MKLTWRIWLLIIVLLLSITSILNFSGIFQDGVLITSVTQNSTAFEQGLRQGQIITAVEGREINNLQDFSNLMQDKFTGEPVKISFTVEDSEIILFSKFAPEITVSDIPKTRIKQGLDLSGGSRALIQAQDKKLSSEEINELVDITNNRFNEFGILDISVRPITDLSGNHFMLVEIAGATKTDLEKLISEQGKFEAKIGNETVFIGGDRDIASVCRNDGTCARIERSQKDSSGNYFSRFEFSITLSGEAATRHAQITEKLTTDKENPEYLSQKLDLYLDDNLVHSLSISKGLQGQVTTQISISGSGKGETEEDAYNSAQESMKKLQTILITGSLPYKLEIVKLDTISPILGSEFIKSIFIAGLSALVAVSIIIFLRYKKIKSFITLLITSISEVIIILGIASFIGQNIDLPGIAGIIATIGTGIDDQIVILDEARFKTALLSLKQKLKRAFSIILGAYFTVLVSLLPLLWAGAGLLKGFAVTTIIGITAGVLITRPAFMDMIKMMEE